MKINFLRKKYPKFIYERYSYKISGRNLEIFFDFQIEPDIYFKPKIIIEDIDKKRLTEIGDRVLDNLIFHLGLMEILSYWKAICSPTIEIRAGYLTPEQIKWWRKLLIEGMGQFYYENKIDWRQKDFLKIKLLHPSIRPKTTIVLFRRKLKNRYLAPFAGGRDSIVTLEGLKKQGKEISLFTVNPNEKIKKALRVSGVKKQIIVRRLLDKKLLELNSRGYLNGHTPFTGVLSFLAVFCAVLFNYKNIAFSNEKSANEGNVKYLGKVINHQWAKSSKFERMFQGYAAKYLVKNINYFSYLRNLGELEISQTFAKYKKYFPVFSSCNNRGVRWCDNCPKCLFVYLALYPYLNKKYLNIIFGQDFFENKKLLPTLKGLLGQGSIKPFECVGTKQESRKAFALSQTKARKAGETPFLLTKIKI